MVGAADTLARVCHPVVVVAAAGQELPVPAGVEIAVDAAPGRGPLEGVAAGIRALDGRAHVAFLAATDLPLLHAEFVTALVAALEDFDAAVAVADGRDQPLAAAYTTRLLTSAPSLLAAGRTRASDLLCGGRVRRLALDDLPRPESLRGMNTPEEYASLLALPPPA